MSAVLRSAAAVLGCAAVAACSSSGAHPAALSSSVPLSGTPQQRFLELVHTNKFAFTGGLAGYSDSTLLAVGRAQCRDFLQHRAGRSSQDARSLATNDLIRVDWPVVAATALVEAADLTLC